MSNFTIGFVISIEIIVYIVFLRLVWIYISETFSEVKNMRSFESGDFYFTRGVNFKAGLDKSFHDFVMESINKHVNCDWGDLSEEDKAFNDRAVDSGDGRIFSSYYRVVQNQEESIWIITEADRSATTVLFPYEY